MTSNARNALVVGVVLTAFMAIVPPAIIGGAKGNIWKVIEQYQTLITGVAAVVAAYATVRQMEKTDARSEQRHRELIELSLRADKLKIERLYDPQHRDMLDHFEQLSDVRSFIIGLHGQSTMDYDAIECTREPIFSNVNAFYEILRRPVWDEAASLFSGGMTAQLSELRESLGQMRLATELAGQAKGRFDQFLKDQEDDAVLIFEDQDLLHREVDLRREYERSVSLIPEFLDQALAPARVVLMQLDELAREYGLR